jgi:hypothetical protein
MSTLEELMMTGNIVWPDVQSQVVEAKLGKPIDELSTDSEIVSAFEALETYYAVWAPELLGQLWRQRQMTEGALRQVLLNVWRYSNFPCLPRRCPSRAWRAMFKITGFLSDGVEKPKRPLVLYRASAPRGRRGMSWTTKRPSPRNSSPTGTNSSKPNGSAICTRPLRRPRRSSGQFARRKISMAWSCQFRASSNSLSTRALCR